MTLVELLIAIAILAILAGLILGVGAVAAETARQANTRSTILRIHTLLVDHYDSFRNRRVSLSDTAENTIASLAGANGRLRGELNAEARLHALRELLLTELPDRWSDIALEPIPNDVDNRTDDDRPLPLRNPLYLEQRTSLGLAMWRRYQALCDRLEAAADADTSDDFDPEDTGPLLKQNQSAECLYLIVTLATGDGEAAGLFSENLIGDTDGDGAREFLDAWGNPIRFLRWAPGADSPAQLSVEALQLVASDNDEMEPGAISDEQAIANAVLADRDPFDLFRVERYTAADDASRLTDSDANNNATGAFGYRLLPLVYSLGGDEESGVVDSELLPDLVVWNPSPPLSAGSSPSVPAANPRFRFNALPDPYFVIASGDGVGRQIGATLDREAATDNVTNHLITAKVNK